MIVLDDGINRQGSHVLASDGPVPLPSWPLITRSMSHLSALLHSNVKEGTAIGNLVCGSFNPRTFLMPLRRVLYISASKVALAVASAACFWVAW